MPRKKRKILFPSASLIVSFYISFLFGTGIVIGFLISGFIIKAVNQGKLKRIFIGLGEWKVHLHHWMVGTIILFVVVITGWFAVLPKIVFGGICGLVLHEFYFDNDWYNIILKKSSDS